VPKEIKFTPMQVSDFLTIIEKHGIDILIDSDAKASTMFSDLLISMARALNQEQAAIFHNEL